ncbi:type II secretion system GspH family protein [Rossellomorea aquimaris]|uniref:competence type IV pilus major pilin ComGC n=1 Tax=Rossellomorea aquimaris TaxID=189382 RepID=UPI001CD1C559|nr:type II secretion system protein [Rossellomorea aquimaris]MCA1057876.1 type II secretion system GspH family protein [Rossellomorea aquimaris]
MLKKMGQRLKNERGLTLIELLAVVVILGIIAAIAVPSIGGLINNSKKDAHIANGQQIVSAARLAVTSIEVDATDGKTFTLKELVDGGYVEDMDNPSGGTYSDKKSKVVVTKNANNYDYSVTLIGEDNTKYFVSKDPADLKRDDIKLN